MSGNGRRVMRAANVLACEFCDQGADDADVSDGDGGPAGVIQLPSPRRGATTDARIVPADGLDAMPMLTRRVPQPGDGAPAAGCAAPAVCSPSQPPMRS